MPRTEKRLLIREFTDCPPPHDISIKGYQHVVVEITWPDDIPKLPTYGVTGSWMFSEGPVTAALEVPDGRTL